MRFSIGKDRGVMMLAAILLVIGATIHLVTMRDEAPTPDEPVYLAAGVGYWQTGRVEFNAEHPPLYKWIQGIPLLFLDPTPPLQPRPALLKLEFPLGSTFLFENRVPADQIVWIGRLPTLILWIVFGAVLFATARRWGGATAGLIALVLYTFDPTLLAHGHLATNDLASAGSFFLAAVFFERMVHRPTFSQILISTCVIVLPLFIKFSGLLIGPIFLVLLFLAPLSWKQKGGMLLAAIGWCIFLLYLITGGMPQIFWDGLEWQLRHNDFGHEAYLFGRWSFDGWWYYFPIAFLVKTPLFTIVLGAVSFVLLLKRKLNPSNVGSPSVPVVYSIIPISFLLTSLFVDLDIGIRYLLPVFPFLFMGIGISIAGWMRTVRKTRAFASTALAVLLSIYAGTIIAHHPHYLSYFNLIAGGQKNGYRILNDSNLDWGQDLKRLDANLETDPVPQPIFLDYFGVGNAGTYYLRDHPFVPIHLPVEPPSSSGTMIVSAFYRWRPTYAWLDSLQPFRTIGSSILLYDLSELRQ
jgi:hypothetical protein